jgi:AbrB family looped-hinge helix DNA binding protein
MDDSTITSKGQVTIPKAVRDRLGLKPGDRVVFTVLQDGTTIMRVKTTSIEDLAGLLHQEGRQTVPTDELSL